MTKNGVLSALVLIISAAGLVAGRALADDAKVRVAQQAAESWVRLVDEGNYGGSWDEASSLFKKSVTREKWVEMAKPVREPLGKMLSRKLADGKYTTEAPGAPDGEYVILQYQTSFENKKSATETLSFMLDQDGKWRAAGFFIK